MINLWPSQVEAVQAVHKEFSKGNRRTLVSMPTGTGKTIVLCACVVMALQAGSRCLVVVPSSELVEQTVRKLAEIGIFAGIVKQDRDEWDRPVVVAQFQTLSRRRRLTRIPPNWFKLVLIDEAHQSYAPSFRRIMRYMCSSWFVGFTATPFRGDGHSLALANWHSVAYVYSIDRAIKEGRLAKPRIIKVHTNVNLDEVEVVKQNETFGVYEDFRATSLEKLVNNTQRNASIVRAYIENCSNQRGIAFCVTRKHALDLANMFRSHGIAAGMVHYKSPAEERTRVLSAHKSGELQVVTNVSLLSTGYDDPGLGAVIMAKPTLSKVLFVQCMGRGLRRLDESKEFCTFLDVVDACSRHKLAVADEVLNLKHDMEDTTLGVTAKERLSFHGRMIHAGISADISDRIAYSDALTRGHLESYLRALESGQLDEQTSRRILGLG